MEKFSKRNNILNKKLDLKALSVEMNSRIVDYFILSEREKSSFGLPNHYVTNIEKVMNELSISVKTPNFRKDNVENERSLKSKLNDINNTKWYDIYDFIEKSLYVVKSKELENQYNRILEEEGSLYRVIKRVVAPIISEVEIGSISEAMETEYDTVNKHINKALESLCDRKNPDYENSIKESILSIEALCSTISGARGKENTLGKTIDLLEEKGILIHASLKEAIKKIYGYTSDEKGIRHAGTIERGADIEDAIFMLVSCSAFVNYIISKVNKENK